MPAAQRPYNLDAAFERTVVQLACSNRKFYNRVGKHVEPEMLSGTKNSPCQIAMRACHNIARDLGQGPGSAVAVCQRVRTMHEHGEVTLDEVFEVLDYTSPPDGDPPDEEVISNELAQILRDRAQRLAVLELTEATIKGGDVGKAAAAVAAAQEIGKSSTAAGSRLGSNSFAAIAGLRLVDRLPTGVRELDAHLLGGLSRGQLGFWAARSGGGKSMALIQQAVMGLRKGMLVGLVTLELPVEIQEARVMARLTKVPVSMIQDGEVTRAQQVFESIAAAKKFGTLYTEAFTPLETTPAMIESWVAQVEQLEGRKMDLLVIDYADKLSSGVQSKNSSSYSDMGIVYERLRIFAEKRKMWVWTASQVRRAGKGGHGHEIIDLDDIADSANKARVSDVVITINPQDDGDQLLFYIAKNRTGTSGLKVGPLPHAFAIASIVPPDDDLGYEDAAIAGGPEFVDYLNAALVEHAVVEGPDP